MMFLLFGFVRRASVSMLCVITVLLYASPSMAEVPVTAPDPPRIDGLFPFGVVAFTGLRLYVAPPYRSMCVAMDEHKVSETLPAIRAAYQAHPDSQDLYIMLSQADPQFRREQFQKYRLPRTGDLQEHFRRGVTILYLYYEWRVGMRFDKSSEILDEAITDLEIVWRTKPTLAVGAVLMDAYDSNTGANRAKALPFTEELLRFVDPAKAYVEFTKARNNNFLKAPLVLQNVTPAHLREVTGVLSERWRLLDKTRGKTDAETKVIEHWWRNLGKQLPKP